MPAKIEESKCVGCGVCVDNCPAEAITLDNGKAKIDESKCIDCANCVDNCPSAAISME